MSGLALGIDLGTTAVKAVALDERGVIVASASAPTHLVRGPGGLVEQPVESIWLDAAAALSCIRRFGAVRSLALSSQGGTLVLLDQSGSPLGNAISWMDTRPATLSPRERTIARSLSPRERVGVRAPETSAPPASAALTLPSPGGRGKEGPPPGRRGGRAKRVDDAVVYEKTGWCLRHGCLPLAQLLRLKPVGGGSAPRVPRVRFVDSYVVERLTGDAATNPSDAAITMLCNVRERRWDPDLLDLAGVAVGALPRIVRSGTVLGPIRPESAEDLGLAPDAVVVAGGHDQYCAAFGAGCRAAGDTIVSCGTAWVLLTMTTGPRFDYNAQLAPAEAVTPGLWGLLGSCSSVGAAVDWFRRAAARPELPFEELVAAAAAVEPSPDAPLFLPPGSEGDGAFLGLGLHHTFGHLCRAVLEGPALSLRALLDRMRAAGCEPTALKAVGGATRSMAWMQILSDAVGLPLEVAGTQDVAAYGAARLAAEATGLIPADAPWPAPATHIEPRPRHRGTYDTLYQRFQEAKR